MQYKITIEKVGTRMRERQIERAVDPTFKAQIEARRNKGETISDLEREAVWHGKIYETRAIEEDAPVKLFEQVIENLDIPAVIATANGLAKKDQQ